MSFIWWTVADDPKKGAPLYHPLNAPSAATDDEGLRSGAAGGTLETVDLLKAYLMNAPTDKFILFLQPG